MTSEEIKKEVEKQLSYVLLYVTTRIPLTNSGCEELRQLYIKCLQDSIGEKSLDIDVKVKLDQGFRSATVIVTSYQNIFDELCSPPLDIERDLQTVNVVINII